MKRTHPLAVDRGALTDRVLRAVRALMRGRVTIDELARAIGSHRRTAFRLLEAFERVGLPLEREMDDEGRGRYHLPAHWWEARAETSAIARRSRVGGRGLNRQAGEGSDRPEPRGGAPRRPPQEMR